jgi:hypothetical protein
MTQRSLVCDWPRDLLGCVVALLFILATFPSADRRAMAPDDSISGRPFWSLERNPP